MKIDLPLFDLTIDRIKIATAHYLLLQKDHMTYHVECFVDKVPDVKNDSLQAKEDVFICYHNYTMKQHIIGIDKEFVPASNGEDKYDVWYLEIVTVGGRSNYPIKVQTESEAIEIQNKIWHWRNKKSLFQKFLSLFA